MYFTAHTFVPGLEGFIYITLNDWVMVQMMTSLCYPHEAELQAIDLVSLCLNQFPPTVLMCRRKRCTATQIKAAAIESFPKKPKWKVTGGPPFRKSKTEGAFVPNWEAERRCLALIIGQLENVLFQELNFCPHHLCSGQQVLATSPNTRSPPLSHFIAHTHVSCPAHFCCLIQFSTVGDSEL